MGLLTLGCFHRILQRHAKKCTRVRRWYVEHALNRGNRREAVFHKAGDYDAFVEAMVDSRAGCRSICRILSDAQPLSPLVENRAGWRPRSLDAVATDGAPRIAIIVTTEPRGTSGRDDSKRSRCRMTTTLSGRSATSNGMR